MTAKPEVIQQTRFLPLLPVGHSAKTGLWHWNQLWSTSRTGFN